MIAGPDLLAAHNELLNREGQMYPRDAARKLGVSERKLLLALNSGMCGISAGTVSRFIEQHEDQSKLVVRNDALVLERDGRFRTTPSGLRSEDGATELTFRPDRVFRTYYLPAAGRSRPAIIWFDETGNPAAKLFGEFTTPEQDAQWEDTDSSIAGADEVIPVAKADFRTAIEKSVNRNLTRIHFQDRNADFTTVVPVAKVMDARGWFNILDEDFNLHLNEQANYSVSGNPDTAVSVAFAGSAVVYGAP